MARKTLTAYKADIAANLTDGGANTPGDVRTLLTDLAESTLEWQIVYYWQNSTPRSDFIGSSARQVRVFANSGLYDLAFPRYTVGGDRYLHVMVLQPSTLNWFNISGVTVPFYARQTSNPDRQLYHSAQFQGTGPITVVVDTQGIVYP